MEFVVGIWPIAQSAITHEGMVRFGPSKDQLKGLQKANKYMLMKLSLSQIFLLKDRKTYFRTGLITSMTIETHF